jgi:hypothetical protein
MCHAHAQNVQLQKTECFNKESRARDHFNVASLAREGKPMPRACTICANAATAEIAKAIATGESNRAVSGRFAVTASAVQRHRVNCLRAPRRTEKLAAPPTRATAPDSVRFDSDADPKALICRAEFLLDDATAICARAKTDGDARLALQALRECRSSLELLMRAHGMLQPDGTTVNIDARRQSVELFAKLSIEELRALARGNVDSEPLRGAGTALAVPVDTWSR